MPSHIEHILKNLPNTHGIYEFFGNGSKIIYIGKSVNLKSRVNSYFNGTSRLNFAKQKMVSEIKDIKYIVTSNETESLILETNLIKEYLPKYNVMLKDGKNHIYIRINNEIIPRIVKTRQRIIKGTYYGPYLSGPYVDNILKILQKAYGYRTCNIVFNKDFSLSNIGNTKIPCMNYYIGLCPAPCLKTAKNIEEYERGIKEIRSFLDGNNSKIKEELRAKMLAKSSELKFEEAGKIKELLNSISGIEETQIVKEKILGEYNIVNYINKWNKFYIYLLSVRNSRITGFNSYEIKHALEEDDKELIKSFVETNFANENNKKIIYILPFQLDFEGLGIKYELPKIGVKKDLLDMAYRNIYEYAYKSHLDSLSTKGFTKKTMQSLLQLLGYKQINKNIIFECNDISHISGNHTVASRSVIENGKSETSKYKKLRIKTLEKGEINDFASMREVINRRLKEIVNSLYIPDLIIIDGGKGQLSSVTDEISIFLRENELEEGVRELIESLQLVSIAKREEELFTPSSVPTPYLLSRDSLELRLVQKIRDEAHRFAINFNRASRLKSEKKNILESLPGFGEKTRKKLLHKYSSVEALKGVSRDELKEILNKRQIETLEEHMLL